MQFIDLKYLLPIGHTSASLRKELDSYEHRQNRLCSTNGILPRIRILEMRGAVRWQLQGDSVHLSGPVPLHGLRSAHVPGKPQGHRSLPSWCQAEAISHGHPEQGFQNTIAHANETRDWRIYLAYIHQTCK
jgi:hypothetical protein